MKLTYLGAHNSHRHIMCFCPSSQTTWFNERLVFRVESRHRFFSNKLAGWMLNGLIGKINKPINIKKFGGTPPLLDRNHPVDMSCLSRENVSSAPPTFCPIYVGLHTNQVGTSGVPGTRHQFGPGTLPRHNNLQFPLCVCFDWFFPTSVLIICTEKVLLKNCIRLLVSMP